MSIEKPADEPVLLRSAEGGVVTLRLNRPSQFNALSEAMLAALQQEIDTLACDADVRCVVLESAGRPLFAGPDIGEKRSPPDPD